MGLKEYLEKGFSRHEADHWAALKVRAFAKWWLDLVRNAVVVAAFVYLARKSESVPLKALAYSTAAVLFGYCTSYFNTWSFAFLPGIKHERWNFWINMVLWLVVFTFVFWIAIAAMASAFNALLTVQTH